MKSFFEKFVGARKRLTRLNDDEPLTRFALAIILLLDVFILVVLFGGLDDHTA